ncbi:hypothetical protein J4E05_16555 [Thalassospira sp. NFXS8]|uniref:hypothetical protein n=1 Tax=Thalassospira sp. NFXS8 TaxID=2819093 RepID=UPI0032DF29B8
MVDGNGDMAGVDTHLHYIQVDDSSLAIHKITIAQDTTQTQKTLCYLLDHVTFVVLTTDAAGAVSEVMSCNVLRARREVSWEAGVLSVRPATRRCFTRHEQLCAVGIVHMNGRIYDPELGRIL